MSSLKRQEKAMYRLSLAGFIVVILGAMFYGFRLRQGLEASSLTLAAPKSTPQSTETASDLLVVLRLVDTKTNQPIVRQLIKLLPSECPQASDCQNLEQSVTTDRQGRFSTTLAHLSAKPHFLLTGYLTEIPLTVLSEQRILVESLPQAAKRTFDPRREEVLVGLRPEGN
ncbi:MAG: hypothetical protein CEO22_183 [Candidatus Berkelbacteria bacterium Gr01-1014_85]|uniref:Uncharacterized protein n=1 Tax=Candidatus Berkelbacteria bacterium Gr01-1014_85 TaxID=2017150 RepID=A0A554JD09_9BACT|nr:MAG: hypothetical protein CEO22_183 [Candidatus Berkelbacteria bacterium Gr01-1014_85]